MFGRQKRLKVEFRNIVSMSPGLAGIIEQLLEPAPEDRFQVIIFSLGTMSHSFALCSNRK